MWDERNHGTWIFVPGVNVLQIGRCPKSKEFVEVATSYDDIDHWYGSVEGSPNFPASGPPISGTQAASTDGGALETCGDCGFRWDPSRRRSGLKVETCMYCRGLELAGEVIGLKQQLKDRSKVTCADRVDGRASATSQAKPATPRGAQVQVDTDWDLLPDA